MQVVRGVGHHLGQVVVVGHAYGHRIAVGLAEIGARIVGYVVLVVLVPVHLCLVVGPRLAVAVVVGLVVVGEDFPSAAQYLVGSGRYVGLLHAHGGAGQHYRRRREGRDGGHSALELQVDVDHVNLVGHVDVLAGVVALVVVVLIYGCYDALLGEVVDFALARDVERGGLGGFDALDYEVVLVVGQSLVSGERNERSGCHAAAFAVGVAVEVGERSVVASLVATVLSHDIRLATVVVDDLLAVLREVLDVYLMRLVLWREGIVGVLRNHLAGSVGRGTAHERLFHYVVVFAGGIVDGLHLDGSIVVLLVGYGVLKVFAAHGGALGD